MEFIQTLFFSKEQRKIISLISKPCLKEAVIENTTRKTLKKTKKQHLLKKNILLPLKEFEYFTLVQKIEEL